MFLVCYLYEKRKGQNKIHIIFDDIITNVEAYEIKMMLEWNFQFVSSHSFDLEQFNLH